MKKFLVLVLTCLSLTAFAQRSNVESAVIYLRNSEIEDAKKVIDEAAEHADTKDDPKMWSVRAAVYDTIYRNPDYRKLDSTWEEKFVVACIKCMETDTKKRYEDYCGFTVINSAFAAYNKGVEYLQNNDSKNALKFFVYVTQVFPYDKNGDLKKNNINEKAITLNMASLAIKNQNNADAKKYLQKLIDMDYNDPTIYLLMANIYYLEGDTTKGLSVTDAGRKRFAGEKDLINQELNIYLAQNKQNVLLDKLNEALSLDEESPTLLYVRGNVYDNFAATSAKNAKHSRDTAIKITNKAKGEKVPANKAKLEASAKRYRLAGDSLQKEHSRFSNLAEKDYLKVIDLNPEHLDGYYNLGALNNNKTTEVVDKMNSLSSKSQSEYDKKFNALKAVKDSILNVSLGYFNKALDLADALPEDDADKLKYKQATQIAVYYSLQQVYANLGDEKKTMEMMNKRKELENQ
ncbi:MAG: tetratricopeptide repeat protein [Bacteroidia bacterium]